MILVIDNIDSFVYNLVQYVGLLGETPVVFQNNARFLDIKKTVKNSQVEHIIISPGPKTPKEAGISNSVIAEYGKKIPTLGVCLGHQCIGYVFGAKIRHARTLMHGKTSVIEHGSNELFRGLPKTFSATRYNSLVIDDEGLPSELEIIATSREDREIMGVRHKKYPIYGLQFHPESILTKHGLKIIKNFLEV